MVIRSCKTRGEMVIRSCKTRGEMSLDHNLEVRWSLAVILEAMEDVIL